MKPDTNLDNLLERAKQRSLRDNGWPHGTAYASNRKWRATYEEPNYLNSRGNLVRKGTWQVFHYDTRLLVIYDAAPDDPESGVLVEPDYSSGLWSVATRVNKNGLSQSDKQGMNTILRHVSPRVTWQALAELDVPVCTEPDEPLSLDRWQPPLRTEDIMGL